MQRKILLQSLISVIKDTGELCMHDSGKKLALSYRYHICSNQFHTSSFLCNKLIKKTAEKSQLEISSKESIPITTIKKKDKSVPRVHKDRERTRKVVETHEEKKLRLKSEVYFDETAKDGKNIETFKAAIDMYIDRESLYRRGHVEFAYAAMSRLHEFGAHKDLATYKKILEILPAGRMVAKSGWQVEWMHYPKQQQCCIDLMEYMEDRGIIPDHEFGSLLAERFGTEAHVFRKYQRIMYWLPKFKHANPYPIPFVLPEDPAELAIMALKRMAVDLENRVTVWKTADSEMEPLEDTFIASAQSPTQCHLLGKHPVSRPLYVEGGYRVWLRDKQLTYFILRAEAKPENFEPIDLEKEEENLFDWKLFFEEEQPTDLVPAFSIHEQEDGTVLASCITGTASKDSLVTWIRYLQADNPNLEQIPVVFTLITPDTGLIALEKDSESKQLSGTSS
ncbi:hypothetical protein ScPMuIL_004941 [Solemya velum]